MRYFANRPTVKQQSLQHDERTKNTEVKLWITSTFHEKKCWENSKSLVKQCNLSPFYDTKYPLGGNKKTVTKWLYIWGQDDQTTISIQPNCSCFLTRIIWTWTPSWKKAQICGATSSQAFPIVLSLSSSSNVVFDWKQWQRCAIKNMELHKARRPVSFSDT